MRNMKRNKNETPTEFGIFVEHMDDRFDQVIEGQQGLQKQINDNHAEFREFREETNLKFEVVFGEFAELHATDGKLERKIDQVLERVINIENEKVGHTEFNALRTRVDVLERREG
jgi:hypothetical protein